MVSVELPLFGDSSQDVVSPVAFLRARMNCNEKSETQFDFVLGKVCVALTNKPELGPPSRALSSPAGR